MHYYEVPKLGSYFAIRLEYESCLFEEAFDEAIKEHKRIDEERVKQMSEKQEFDENQADIKREKEENGEEYIAEVRDWPQINPLPYKVRKVQFCVCMNTMGQDRKYTDKERVFALRAVQ